MVLTTEQKINRLNWFDHITKLRNILKALLTQSTPTHKVYTALITQTGTNDPVVRELENTLGDVTWTRDDEGNYLATSDSLFTTNKTWTAISNKDYSYYTEFGVSDSSTIYLNTKLRNDGTDTDGALTNTSIKIEVYN